MRSIGQLPSRARPFPSPQCDTGLVLRRRSATSVTSFRVTASRWQNSCQTHSPQPERRRVDRAFYQGPVRCAYAEGRYLVFATTLGEEKFRRVFARFRVVY